MKPLPFPSLAPEKALDPLDGKLGSTAVEVVTNGDMKPEVESPPYPDHSCPICCHGLANPRVLLLREMDDAIYSSYF